MPSIVGLILLLTPALNCSWTDSAGLAQVLLLDEITVDLDVLGRADLFAFLRGECEERNVTIIYVRQPSTFAHATSKRISLPPPLTSA